MPTITCKKQHANPNSLNLPENQAGTGRHKCPMCAYEIGMGIGQLGDPLPQNNVEYCQHDKFAPYEMLAKLPESQAVIRGRHKCAVCAFNQGHEAGKAWKAAHP